MQKLNFSYAQSRDPVRTRGMSQHLPIASFDESEPADALARRLRAEGFGAITSNDSAEQLLQCLNPHPRAQNHVLVPGEQIEAALRRLKELDASEQVLRFAICCPDCGSSQVEYPQFSRKTLVGAILPALAAAAGIVERLFYCAACHFTWTPAENAAKTVQPGNVHPK